MRVTRFRVRAFSPTSNDHAQLNTGTVGVQLADLSEEFGDDENHTSTPVQMSPEQMEGQAVTARNDIYSS